jgi:hypothetical protein
MMSSCRSTLRMQIYLPAKRASRAARSSTLTYTSEVAVRIVVDLARTLEANQPRVSGTRHGALVACVHPLDLALTKPLRELPVVHKECIRIDRYPDIWVTTAIFPLSVSTR